MGNLRKRLNMHRGEKPHKCNQCNYASSWTSNLRRHKKEHKGEKPHKCKECNYASIHASNLRKHLKTHSGKKSHKCNHCNFSSVHAQSLKYHLNIHNGENQTNATNVTTHPPGQIVCIPEVNFKTQPPASIGYWLFVVRPASVTSLFSTIWCFWAFKPYILCEDMILATFQCQHIFSCWVEPSLLLSSSCNVLLFDLCILYLRLIHGGDFELGIKSKFIRAGRPAGEKSPARQPCSGSSV